MNVTLRQNVISGESTKMNSPESFLASRILIADPDQSPAACRIRQMRKELEAASRKYSLLEEEFLGLKKVCEAKDAEIASAKRETEIVRSAKDAEISDLNASYESELAHVRESKDAEIALAQSETRRVLDEKSAEIVSLKASHSRELKEVCEVKDAEIASAKRETEIVRSEKDAEISDLNASYKSELAHVRESKDAEIVSLQREMKRGVGKIVDSHCSHVEINAEMERLKLEAKKKGKEISLLRSAKRRASSSILQKNKEIAALEFELRRIRSKSRWKRIGCFVCGVFTLPVLILLGAVICD